MELQPLIHNGSRSKQMSDHNCFSWKMILLLNDLVDFFTLQSPLLLPLADASSYSMWVGQLREKKKHGYWSELENRRLCVVASEYFSNFSAFCSWKSERNINLRWRFCKRHHIIKTRTETSLLTQSWPGQKHLSSSWTGWFSGSFSACNLFLSVFVSKLEIFTRIVIESQSPTT